MKRQRSLRALRAVLPFVLVLAPSNIVLRAQADAGSCPWERGGLHRMHWAQPPDEGFTGVDVSVSQTVLADDFRCTITGPIRSIHIWGSFLDDVLPEKGPGVLTFELSIRANLPNPEGTWSRPGEVLWSRVFKPGEYTASKIHDGPQDWFDVLKSQHLGADHRDTYQYDFCIGQEPFVPEAGGVYWLAVKELSPGTNYTFGWRTTARQFRWNGDATYLHGENAGWFKMTYPDGHRYAKETLDLAFVVTDGDDALPQYDFGDAPDSSNNVPGAAMVAYPDGTVANFPTACHADSPPYGPGHRFPRDKFHLGRWVSLESEADIGVDEDSVSNLDSRANRANRDGGDDGLGLPLVMPSCRETTLKYTINVTGPGTIQPYVNVWCDWNRDGDWNDTVDCDDGAVREWAVQNQQPTLTEPGMHTITSPAFRCWHPASDVIDPMWLRITISEQPWQPAAGDSPGGGSGPEGGYMYGETEDYYIRPLSGPTPVRYDWGDAPDGAKTAGYPTLAVHDGARHTVAGPWLGDKDGRPDGEEDGQPHMKALGDDDSGSNDEKGVSIPPLVQGQLAAATIEVNGGGGVVQAWIDFNDNRAWEEQEKVFDSFLPDGIHAIPFTVPANAAPGETFARFRISRAGGLRPSGEASDGEVEDHRVWIDEIPDGKSWCQWPDTTPEGVSVRVDGSDQTRRAIADDFECKIPGRLAHVRLWGSWMDDHRGVIAKIRLRIHPDDPVGSAGREKTNRYSKPGTEVLWEQEYIPDQFEETPYHVASIGGLWWRDPASAESAPGQSTQIWQIDVKVDPNDAFMQEGVPAMPKVYWLAVEVDTINGQFGWSTRQWPEHFAGDAVWDTGTRLPRTWHESFYPHGHAHYDVERNSEDMAFCLLFRAESVGQATSQPISVTQCPATETMCPIVPTRCWPTVTQCPPVETLCPSAETQCWQMPTQCPPQETQCPAEYTWCPVAATLCPATETQCPSGATQCPITATHCPLMVTECEVIQTVCPVVQTACPRVVTQCELVQTMCPTVQTYCPTLETNCPPILTECPRGSAGLLPLQMQSATAVIGTSPVSPATACPPVEADCPTVGDYAVATGAAK